MGGSRKEADGLCSRGLALLRSTSLANLPPNHRDHGRPGRRRFRRRLDRSEIRSRPGRVDHVLGVGHVDRHVGDELVWVDDHVCLELVHLRRRGRGRVSDRLERGGPGGGALTMGSPRCATDTR